MSSSAVCSVAESPTFREPSTEFAASGTQVPRKVLYSMRRAGADMSRALGLTLVDISTPEAQEVFNAFLCTLCDEDDPLVSVSDAHSRPVELECRSILVGFSTMKKAGFANAHSLLPLLSPPTHVRFHHCQFSLSALPVFLQAPGSGFPSISSVPRGALVCKVCQVWAGGTTILLNVYRQ